jgi:hypothetical protein
MSVNNINNGDSASGIREKLNEIIAIANHYSSSAFTGAGGGAPTGSDGGGGGASYDSLSFYSSGLAVLTAELSSADACSAIANGTPYDVYISKDPANMNGSSVPEVNDTIYSDSSGTSIVASGWYGFYDMSAMVNKSIEITSGSISTINTCA